MNKVKNPSNYECYISSGEAFSLYNIACFRSSGIPKYSAVVKTREIKISSLNCVLNEQLMDYLELSKSEK
jgi:hypothetical protein